MADPITIGEYVARNGWPSLLFAYGCAGYSGWRFAGWLSRAIRGNPAAPTETTP